MDTPARSRDRRGFGHERFLIPMVVVAVAALFTVPILIWTERRRERASTGSPDGADV